MKINNSPKQLLIQDINDLLEQPSSLLTPIVRKASRLAQLCNQLKYQALFELHLDGLSDSASRISKWPATDREPSWDYAKAFCNDRTTIDGYVTPIPLEQIETAIQGAKEMRETYSAKG